jgi:neuropeptide S receptor 1
VQTSFHWERLTNFILPTLWASDFDLYYVARFSFVHADAEQNRSLSSFAEDTDVRRASSRGIIPQAKIKTIKMTFIIVCGKST